ncbi:MAG: hypothetical protein CVU47_00125 [Chloroflexi bacterium HGW-Chloroflexi-9]|nr:MAG: hypothetical protein CVU47_00125 [Chloroflexi bacterium HGW-Chloroflexi-9]
MIPGQTASTNMGPSGPCASRFPMYATFLSICWTVENVNSPPGCSLPRRDVNDFPRYPARFKCSIASFIEPASRYAS